MSPQTDEVASSSKANSFRNQGRAKTSHEGSTRRNKGFTRAENSSQDSHSSDSSASQNVGVKYVNLGEEDQMEIHGYRRSIFWTTVTWFFIVITVGILRMVYHWFPEWFLNCTHTKCSLEAAEKVLLVEICQEKYRKIHIRTIIRQTALQALTIANQEELSTSNKNHNEDYVLEEFNKATEVLSLPLPNPDGTFHEVENMRLFTCKKLRYVWNERSKEFFKLKSLGPGIPTSSLHCPDAQQGLAGLSLIEQQKRRAVYGRNTIYVPVRPILELLMLEVINPFYIFQVVSILIWIAIWYYFYAAAIAVMSIAGIIITITQTRRNQRKLRNTVRGNDIITVCRGNGDYHTVGTEDLVPGDVIVIPAAGCVLHCDAVLLFGTCIVNESMLTGESVPVTKTPLPMRNDVFYNPREHARHTLFSGTRVVQTRFYDDEKVMAVVTSTGFLTAKGTLVSSIMYPPPADYKFERDSYKFIGFLASLASIGFIYSMVTKIMNGDTGLQVLLHSFDLITVCVPPALPAAMAAGIILAQRRLELRNIFCISPRAINVSGSINCVCFDKTGTLTEEGLDLWGVVPVARIANFLRVLSPVTKPCTLPGAVSAVTGSEMSHEDPKKELPYLLFKGMATCHSLTIIDGTLNGDPLDLKMFESTGWNLIEPSHDDTHKYDNLCPTVVTWTPNESERHSKVEVGIVRQFPFSSALQRMAVLCKEMGKDQMHFFCKGSPEMIQSLSLPETVPENYHELLESYTKQGFRVIALAHRLVESQSINKLQKVQREDLEHGLTFLGLVVLENRLKPDSAEVLAELASAAVRTIMVTGDNLLTAISVARDCEMVGENEEIVIVNCDETTLSEDKPRLTFALAEKVSRQLTGSPTATRTNMSIAEDVILSMPDTGTHYGRYHLAITGKSWSVIQEHYSELIPNFVVKGTIFARMSPDQKQQLVVALQKTGYFVGMCGDGANDCGALKAAHAGIALTDSEASVASPFTSKEPSISCVPELIRQGRCALVTSFGIFNYMAIYALIQFFSVMILFEVGTNLSDFQFLYVDFFIICSLSAFFGQTQPYPGKLFKRPPLTSLLSPPPVGSLVIQALIILLIQLTSLFVTQQQDWFVPYLNITNGTLGTELSEYACSENYAVVGVSFSQYIFLALVYSKGKPYRKMFLTNYGFTASLALWTGFSLYLLIDPNEYLKELFELEMPPELSFRFFIIGLSILQVALCLLIEAFLVDRGLVAMMNSSCWLKMRPRQEMYLEVEQKLSTSRWPLVSNYDGDPPPEEHLSSVMNQFSAFRAKS